MYKYKDILFGLREEYLRNEAKLKQLEEYVQKNAKRDVRFFLEKEDEQTLVELYYSLNKRNNIIRAAITKLLGRDVSYEAGKMAKTANGQYQPSSQLFSMDETKKEEVIDIVGELYSDPFNSSFNTVIENNEQLINMDRKLMIYPDRIITYRRLDTEHLSSVYDPKTDTVTFRNNKGKVTYDDMYDVLDLEFSKDALPPYLQLAVAASNTYGVDTFIYDNDNNRKEKRFTPLVKEKRLILNRQK